MSTRPSPETTHATQPRDDRSPVIAEAVRRARARLAAQAKPGEGVSHTDFPGHHTCA